ncbi:KpsF/GutQ family sugar-phosphate isomerase [Bdellovibrio sp. HCB337]|uniref:KpsF/GutQ family sugar-phosphate isomerase n=1 Tax=Bdellovibrio sp. HCB337 TaxID=3394358 RepID=UPI0039A452A0
MSSKIIQQGLQVLDIEARAILALKDRLNGTFEEAVKIVQSCEGKLIVTGMGKSGQIARKLASTFSSTGTPAVFLHPAESAHGDLGIVEDGDVILALSYGGETPELAPILAFALRKDIPVIAVTGNMNSTLAKAAKVTMNVSVSAEACPLNLAPTASSTASLAMGDAMAMAVLNEKGFSPEEFAEYHPGGSLGYRLLTRVKDVMHTGEALPLVQLDTPVREVLSIMTHKNVRGTAGVLDSQGDLVGVITDGDIRRRLEKSPDPLTGTAKELMTTNPRGVDANELAEKALFLMEQFRIQILFVFDKLSNQPKKPVGILNFQDLLRTKVR